MFDYKSNNLPKIFDATWQLNSDIHDHEVRNAYDMTFLLTLLINHI